MVKLLNAAISYLAAFKIDSISRVTDEQFKAYADFVKAISRLAVKRRSGGTDNEETLLAEINDAKTRIVVAAPNHIVSLLEHFWKCGGTLEREHEIQAFTNLVLAMRAEHGHDAHDLLKQDIGVSNILFQLEPSIYSYRAGNNEDETEYLYSDSFSPPILHDSDREETMTRVYKLCVFLFVVNVGLIIFQFDSVYFQIAAFVSGFYLSLRIMLRYRNKGVLAVW